VPGVPSAEELSALPAAELAVRLAEAYRLIAELTAQIERLSARRHDTGLPSGTGQRPRHSEQAPSLGASSP
jgi:hypothetical protein